MFERIAAAAERFAGWVVLAWLAAAVALVVAAPSLAELPCSVPCAHLEAPLQIGAGERELAVDVASICELVTGERNRPSGARHGDGGARRRCHDVHHDQLG